MFVRVIARYMSEIKPRRLKSHFKSRLNGMEGVGVRMG